MNEQKRKEIALKRFALISPVLNGFEQNAAAYFRAVCDQPIDMPHYGVREYSRLSKLTPEIFRREENRNHPKVL